MVEEILKIICKAAEQVKVSYLDLKTTYEPSGIVRERVFCYELYHQLRLIIGDSHKLTLNGEIDKRGHKDFKKEDRKNPDFVFHIPGQHEGNTIILEVKGNDDFDGIIKDFETMTSFVSTYHYQAGVFLFYNHSLSELMKGLGDKFDKFIYSEYADKLFVITLPEAHKIEQLCSLNTMQKSKEQ